MALVRLRSAIALVAFVAFGMGCDTQPRFPERAEIERLEAAVSLPSSAHPSAHPIREYARYYWLMRSNSDREILPGCSVPAIPRKVTNYPLVRGRYIFSPENGDKPGVYFTRKPVRWCDGGCDIIELLYDPKEQRVLSLGCNGWELKELP